MNEPDLPSDSDVSDDDYRPSGEESCAASEEESGPDDDDVENLNEDGENGDLEKQNGKRNKKGLIKRKKTVKRRSLKRKVPIDNSEVADSDNEIDKKEKELNPEEQKKKVDSLWADFLKDCGGPAKKKPSLDNNTTDSNSLSNVEKNNSGSSSSKDLIVNKTIEEKENTSTVTQIFEFAGEKIRVEKEVPTNVVTTDNGTGKSPVPAVVGGRSRGGRGGASRGGGGVGSSALTTFLGQLGKKGKLSTLEKSKLDWDQFKKKEGIEDDIQLHNKGKDGYLEKQDFLQRTDLRRFEIEKALRQKRSGR